MENEIYEYLKHTFNPSDRDLEVFFTFFNFNKPGIEIVKDLVSFSFLCQTTKTLETRKPFKVIREDGKIVALGLADDEKDVLDILKEQKKEYNWNTHALIEITAKKYNEYLESLDYPSWHIFGE